jgi:hypothetical protein
MRVPPLVSLHARSRVTLDMIDVAGAQHNMCAQLIAKFEYGMDTELMETSGI